MGGRRVETLNTASNELGKDAAVILENAVDHEMIGYGILDTRALFTGSGTIIVELVLVQGTLHEQCDDPPHHSCHSRLHTHVMLHTSP